jgi:hypothetical protein
VKGRGMMGGVTGFVQGFEEVLFGNEVREF